MSPLPTTEVLRRTRVGSVLALGMTKGIAVTVTRTDHGTGTRTRGVGATAESAAIAMHDTAIPCARSTRIDDALGMP